MTDSAGSLAIVATLAVATWACDSNWQGAEPVDDRPHLAVQDPQPATAMAGGKAVVVWNRELLVGTTRIRHTWARVHDGGGWSSFNDLGSETRYPQVAGSADGTAITLVSDGAVRYDGSDWSTPVPLHLDEDPSIAMDDSGRAIVVGSSGARTQAVLFAPDSGWAEGMDIGAAGREYRVAMNGTGMAVVAWCQGYEVWANVYRTDGSWTGAQHVLDGCLVGGAMLVFGTTALDVTLNGTGEAHIAASAPAGVFVTTYSPLAGFGAPTAIDLGDDLSFPQLASNSHGNALLLWARRREENSIWARYYRPGSGWEGPFIVAPRSSYSRKGVWLDDSGTGQVSYIAGSAGGLSAYAREFNGNAATFFAPVSLEALEGPAYYLSSAGNRNGYGVIAWNAGGLRSSGEQIWANRYVP